MPESARAEESAAFTHHYLPAVHLAPTPELQSESIYQALGRIHRQEAPLLLPAIQRHFVWGREQICEFFDSILQGYPIGTFLFWEIEDTHRSEYTCYEFIRDFSEHASRCYNPTAASPLPRGATGVLDGQQRLNSLYVALQGSYAGFCGGQGNHRSKEASFPKTELFLNLLFQSTEEDRVHYHFAFLDEREADPARWKAGVLWFRVKDLYQDESLADVRTTWNQFLTTTARSMPPLSKGQAERAFAILDLLRRRIREEQLIRHFPVRGRSLTEALKIFIRANNGGTRVTDAEMIFATIVAHWREGRDKIQQFEGRLNAVGSGYNFGISRLMQACLALSGGSTRLRIESFRKPDVEAIRSHWETIQARLKEAAELGAEWGFSANDAIPPTAIIALACLLNSGVDRKRSNSELRQFVLRTILCNFFRRADKALHRVREYAQERLGGGEVFMFADFAEYMNEQHGASLTIGPEALDEFIMTSFWEPRCYILLALLHPQHALHEKDFHKDHIHPQARFNDLTEFKLKPESEALWHDWKNRLPNLQLLQGLVNIKKQDTPFADWLNEYLPDELSRQVYLNQNDIPQGISLEFKEFESFFSRRKIHLRHRLKNLLEVKDPEQSPTTPLPSSSTLTNSLS